MYKLLSKSYKETISRKILDIAGILPKFQGGFIHELQSIREHQIKWSSREFQKRIRPDNSNLTLKEIRLVISFQLEEFHLIPKIISKLFPSSEKVSKFIKDLKEKESSISASSWSNIGLIVKDKGLYAGETQLVDNLPEYIRIVQVSYHRIMPSVSCLSFTFYVEDKFSDKLTRDQQCEYLPPVIFNNINFFKKYTPGYSMGAGNDVSKEVIRNQIYKLASACNEWLEGRLHIAQTSRLPKSIIERFELKGNPVEDSELTDWFGSNRGWLNDYGISGLEFDTFRNNYLLFSESNYPNGRWPVYALITLENNEEKERYINFRMDAVSVAAAIFGILDYMQLVLEKHRMSGFQFLAKFDTKILNKTLNVNTLKRLGIILNRFKHEFQESNSWISHSIGELSDLKRNVGRSEQNLAAAFIDQASYRINTIASASNIIDIGLTGYLEIQNIYAMYRLQRWMFILSAVVTIATLVGVLSGWSDLVKLWEGITKWYNNSIHWMP